MKQKKKVMDIVQKDMLMKLLAILLYITTSMDCLNNIKVRAFWKGISQIQDRVISICTSDTINPVKT